MMDANRDDIEVKLYDWTAKYYRNFGKQIIFPYRIAFCYGNNGHGSEKDKDFAEVITFPQEIKINGRYCENLRELSREQLTEKGIETRLVLCLKGKARKQKRSLARLVVKDELRAVLKKLEVNRLIKTE